MPDGYGDNMPSWALSNKGWDTHNNIKAVRDAAQWVMADHLRLDHEMPLHLVARRTGLPYKQVREKYGAKE